MRTGVRRSKILRGSGSTYEQPCILKSIVLQSALHGSSVPAKESAHICSASQQTLFRAKAQSFSVSHFPPRTELEAFDVNQLTQALKLKPARKAARASGSNVPVPSASLRNSMSKAASKQPSRMPSRVSSRKLSEGDTSLKNSPSRSKVWFCWPVVASHDPHVTLHRITHMSQLRSAEGGICSRASSCMLSCIFLFIYTLRSHFQDRLIT